MATDPPSPSSNTPASIPQDGSIKPLDPSLLLRARALSFYKRDRVRELLVLHAQDREVGVRFGEYFRRPDNLRHPSDVLELAMNGATSFHASEERWTNPLALEGNPSKQELEQLRTAWDLILDIDCVEWRLAKAIAALFVEALRRHGISSISCKFSGNKGFHIGVPAEAFPLHVNGKPIKALFPDGPRAIASYLIDYAEMHSLVQVEPDGIRFLAQKFLYAQLPKTEEQLIIRRCTQCGRIAARTNTAQYEHLCERCGHSFTSTSPNMQCPKCAALLRPTLKEARCACTPLGKKTAYVSVVDLQALLDLDTLLISSRHLYRMPYSLHEKSGLASIPIDPDAVISFEKAMAEPATAAIGKIFLDASHTDRGEGARLIEEALAFMTARSARNPDRDARALLFPKEISSTRFEEEGQAKLPETCFPPCMKLLLGKLTDGKKRSMFILTNFLAGCNWTPAEIEARLQAWNQAQDEPIRDTILLGHLRYHAQRSKLEKTPPPPNCDKYYPDLQVCVPDELCRTIKNPLQYAKKKARILNRSSARGRKEPPKPEEPAARIRKPAARKSKKKTEDAPAQDASAPPAHGRHNAAPATPENTTI